jgi:N-acetylglucosaminyldiphosphoundecaprenol N-acetyl-beta-D-mannosaminyltransferase
MPVLNHPSTTRRDPVAILGVPFDNVTTPETLAIIEEMIASRQPHYAATANVDFVVQAMADVELRRILFDTHLVLADGMPLVWASKFLGNPLRERVTGSGMIPLLLAEAERKGWRVFFLGGTEQSVAAAAEKTLAKHSRLQLVGAYSPPFKPLLEMDHEDILRRVHEARPDILLVAFGCPKQEKWINMNYRAAGAPFSVGVGATIDFLAGTFKRAPVWMQNTGTEWIFRMLQEPRRLAKRYGKDLWHFSIPILRQWWQMRSRRRPATTGEATAAIPGPPGILIVRTQECLSAAEVQKSREEWSRALEEGGLVFDMSETNATDSTGVGVLIRLRKRSRELGRAFVLAGPRPPVLAALRLMKLEDFFVVEPDVIAAVARAKTETGPIKVAATSPRGDRVIAWRGEATAANIDDLASQTEKELGQLPPGGRATIDLAELRFADSSGVGLMVRLKKHLWRRSVAVVFRNPTGPVREVLRLTKLESYLLDEKP